jgi:hypothetical protein
VRTQELVQLVAAPHAAGECRAQLVADRGEVHALAHVLAVRAQPPRLARGAASLREEPEVPRRDDVDGRAHQRGLDGAPALERAREILETEALEARPEPDVPRRRVLRLQAGDLLERPAEGQARPFEEQLTCEQRAVQVARREDALARPPAHSSSSLSAAELMQ